MMPASEAVLAFAADLFPNQHGTQGPRKVSQTRGNCATPPHGMIVSVRLLKSPSTVLVADCVVVGALGDNDLQAWTSGERNRCA